MNGGFGHPIEITYDFIEDQLHSLLSQYNRESEPQGLPYLAGLLALSVFDQALHDAYGNLHQVDIYQTYNREFTSTRFLIGCSKQQEHPALFDMVLYVERPFPHDLEANQIDVLSVSQRKPLFLDESAHDWNSVNMGPKKDIVGLWKQASDKQGMRFAVSSHLSNTGMEHCSSKAKLTRLAH